MNSASLFRPWLEPLAGLSPLVAILAKLTALLAVAWVAQALLCRANPRWRVLVWRGAAIGLLLVPLCHLLTPPIELQVPVATMAVAADDSLDATDKQAEIAGGDLETTAILSIPTGDEFLTHEPVATNVHASGVPSGSTILLVIWIGGCLFCLLRITVGMRRIRVLLAGSETAPAGVKAEFHRVAQELSVAGTARVRVSTRITAPILCGILRPTLLIPPRMAERSRAEQLPAVFAHELAHVRSCDLAWNLLLHSISAVLWFHPLAWFARSVHAEACDSVSDAVAASYLGDVQAYGRTLARVALDAIAPPALSLAMARTSNVQQRVLALQRRVHERRLSRPLACAAMGCGLLLTGVIGGLNTVRAQVSDAPQSSIDATTTKNDKQQGDVKDRADGEATKEKKLSLVTTETEAAVNKALAFLASRQRSDGSFGGAKRGDRDPVMTALSGMAFLAGGSKPGEGPYGDELQKALDYMLSHVHDSGFIGVRDNAASMYSHAYALRFLAEAHLARKSPDTEEAISQAVALIVKSQNAQDGWRYATISQDADSSVTSCQVIALQAARRAGAEVPKETIERAVNYLQRCQLPDGGFTYVLSSRGTPALPRSSAAMAALYLCDLDDEPMKNGLKYLNANMTPPDTKADYYYFTQFHLSTALPYAGDEHFRRWYAPIREQLLKLQTDDGSWPLEHYEPEYATAKACIVLLSPRKTVVRLAEQ